MAMLEIDGGLKEHYAKIWDYTYEILRSNLGSSVIVGVNGMPDGSNVFSRSYICFKALKEGCVSCRKVMDLDGTFLKGLCKGELLIATGRDANNQIYSIAWAIVKVENKDNWKWFIECLKDDIGISGGRGLTFLSDQHNGLVEAIKDFLPYVEHRQCARHIHANFKKKYNGRNARRKPIITMLEDIRMFLMERNYIMSKDSHKWKGNVCPNIRKKITERSKDSSFLFLAVFIFLMFFHVVICCRKYILIPSGGNVFEVRDAHDAYTVDLDNMACSCRLWQITGLPCLHTMSSIYYINKDPEEYEVNGSRLRRSKKPTNIT
ncbi:uncharacterized protein LOC110893128 [Helianthus annuus]|uniref:uncharacterized protein LOC110893128 n=1 Tax=Helianthus annuus TaxID=4232 RepID=UPI000B907C2E|nr:uncharacterized protein LOC110893128 [Helianthus annuus]